MESTIHICRRIGGMPIGLSTTQHLIAAKALPRALHGCECTSVNVDAARKLRSGINQALLGPHYSSSSPEIVLQSPARTIIDPELRTLDLRLIAMRRGIHKNIRRGHSTEERVKQLIRHYERQGEYMTGGQQALRHSEAAPPLSSKDRKNGVCTRGQPDQWHSYSSRLGSQA